MNRQRSRGSSRVVKGGRRRWGSGGRQCSKAGEAEVRARGGRTERDRGRAGPEQWGTGTGLAPDRWGRTEEQVGTKQERAQEQRFENSEGS